MNNEQAVLERLIHELKNIQIEIESNQMSFDYTLASALITEAVDALEGRYTEIKTEEIQ